MKPLSQSVKVIVFHMDGRCLVLKRSMASKGNPGKWDFPGGKIDPGEVPEEAAKREAREETGLQIETGRVLGSAESESPANRIAYVILEGHALSREVRLSDEHESYAWVEPGQLSEIDLVPQFRAFALSLHTSGCRPQL